MAEYDFNRIENEWQAKWAKDELYKAENNSTKKKFYALDMFPYPSGAGLHVGHPLGYIASDIFSRYKRLNGYNVLHPMGFDAFGLPAEQYAIQTGKHPEETTKENIETYKRQLNNIGLSFDWSREVVTSNPKYYKWTQWIFTQMFNHYYCNKENKARPIENLIQEFERNGNQNTSAYSETELSFNAEEWKTFDASKKSEALMNYRLAYRKTSFVNWCEELGTVLANDEVVNGLSERGGFPVTQKALLQWSLRISAYAERLLQGLKKLDWSDSLKTQQENWIGKSIGASVVFDIVTPNPSPSPKIWEGDNSSNTNGPQWQTADSSAYKHTRLFQMENRKNPTKAESFLWDRLKTKQLGFKFRRQHIVDTFIPDFICLEKMLIVEVDGEIHNIKESKEYDLARTHELNKLGYNVIRFTNNEIEKNIDQVLETILSELNKFKSKESPLPPSGEGLGLGVKPIEVFTTRPDTIFGATFMVLAPEHTLLNEIVTAEQKEEINSYQEAVKSKSSIERQAGKEVSGVFTGAYAIHPFTKKEIPIWTSDYVLVDYGTGAIMAVPSDDERDRAFANKMGIEIIEICDKSKYPNATAADKVGIMQNSGFLNGMEVKEAIAAAIKEIDAQGIGNSKVNYRLRDANFSRQRYWGEPFPIFYTEDGVAHTLPNERLPLELPPMDDIKPENGKAPLSKVENWKHQGNPLDTDTMPGNAGSSWYFLRYMDPNNDDEFCSPEALKYWQDVDLYIGGTEHAVGHLMYARFWHKFLYDLGFLPTEEPFKKLLNQGMIQGIIEMVYMQKEKVNGNLRFLCAGLAAQEEETEFVKIPVLIDFIKNYGSDESYLDLDSIKRLLDWRPEYKDAIFECTKGIFHKGKFTPKQNTTETTTLYTHSEVGKMSKSKFNVVNPDAVINEYGADCFRMFEMFLGPIETAKPWNTKGIDGVAKFLRKFWNLFHQDDTLAVSQEKGTKEELKILHTCIKKVTEDIERFSFNTCISAFMICVNDLNEHKCNKDKILKPLLALMAPFAPHLTEELWKMTGEVESVHKTNWPEHKEEYLIENTKKYPVSINGKMRTTLDFALDMPRPEMETAILGNEIVQKWMENKPLKKLIIVPGKIINVVV